MSSRESVEIVQGVEDPLLGLRGMWTAAEDEAVVAGSSLSLPTGGLTGPSERNHPVYPQFWGLPHSTHGTVSFCVVASRWCPAHKGDTPTDSKLTDQKLTGVNVIFWFPVLISVLSLLSSLCSCVCVLVSWWRWEDFQSVPLECRASCHP